MKTSAQRPVGATPSDCFSGLVLERDWRMLCETIGERRAGSAAERVAAEYLVAELKRAGAGDAHLEGFPCLSVQASRAEVAEPRGRSWRRVEAAAVVGAPSTPEGAAVEGELVWLEFPEQAVLLKPGSLRGRIAALFGPLPTELAHHRQLLAAAPLAVIHIDERLPFTWTKNDGVYPYWAREYGMLPTLTVPYLDAWRWKRDGVVRLRVLVAVQQVETQSCNVVATLPGSDPKLPAIVLSAHHDTQCGNPGADDNASGVVCVLALARFLAGAPRTRPIQLCSFGTEEQLSVGATAHVRQQKVTPREVGLVVNFDSVASPLGHWQMLSAGSRALERTAAVALAGYGLPVAVQREITPFGDVFPFNRVGIPSLWFFRSNFPGGRWQHHSRHDTLANVSTAEVQRLLHASAPFIADLANQSRWPFPSRLPPVQASLARRLGRELLGW